MNGASQPRRKRNKPSKFNNGLSPNGLRDIDATPPKRAANVKTKRASIDRSTPTVSTEPSIEENLRNLGNITMQMSSDIAALIKGHEEMKSVLKDNMKVSAVSAAEVGAGVDVGQGPAATDNNNTHVIQFELEINEKLKQMSDEIQSLGSLIRLNNNNANESVPEFRRIQQQQQ